MLVVAKDHAVKKGLQEKRLVVGAYIKHGSADFCVDDTYDTAEAWVTKGPKCIKRLEPRGRGHFGVRVHPDSRLSVVLKEGKTVAEVKQEDRQKKLKRVVSAGLIREDVPIRNPYPAWGW